MGLGKTTVYSGIGAINFKLSGLLMQKFIYNIPTGDSKAEPDRLVMVTSSNSLE